MFLFMIRKDDYIHSEIPCKINYCHSLQKIKTRKRNRKNKSKTNPHKNDPHFSHTFFQFHFSPYPHHCIQLCIKSPAICKWHFSFLLYFFFTHTHTYTKRQSITQNIFIFSHSFLLYPSCCYLSTYIFRLFNFAFIYTAECRLFKKFLSLFGSRILSRVFVSYVCAQVSVELCGF